MFLVSVSQQFNLPFEQLSKLYLETAEQAIKVPRKYTKKPKAVTVATEEGSAETPTEAAAAPAAKAAKAAKADKQKCTACTSKKEPCKFSALKGEVFCKRHLRASQETNGESQPKEKAAKKPAKAEQPVHTHELTQQPTEPCELCESHGNPLTEDEPEFEVVLDEPQPRPAQTVAERLAALLEDSGSESEAESETEFGLMEEAFEDD